MNRSPNANIESRRQFVCFTLDGTKLAVKITSSPEVGYLPAITPLPNLPGWLKGVGNIRGEIVSIVDLKGFLKFPGKSEPHEKKRLIVVQNGDMKTGLIVDKILGILSSDRHGVVFQDYSHGIDRKRGLLDNYVEQTAVFKKREFHMLDAGKLLACPRMNRFSR